MAHPFHYGMLLSPLKRNIPRISTAGLDLNLGGDPPFQKRIIGQGNQYILRSLHGGPYFRKQGCYLGHILGQVAGGFVKVLQNP
jgi:hypothetical protein